MFVKVAGFNEGFPTLLITLSFSLFEQRKLSAQCLNRIILSMNRFTDAKGLEPLRHFPHWLHKQF